MQYSLHNYEIKSSASTQCECPMMLPNEIWIRSFSYLDSHDSTVVGYVSRLFLSLSSSDSLWEAHCRRRWRGKQNVERFACKNSREGSRCAMHSDGRVEYCMQLLRQFRPTHLPPMNMGSLMHEPISWKESYIMAEIDSQRIIMTREELVYFRWKLIYDGTPSQLGLRKFNDNGTYWSPYMGICEWFLHLQQLSFAGMTLLVERNPSNWGWVIGRGQRTEYNSVDDEND